MSESTSDSIDIEDSHINDNQLPKITFTTDIFSAIQSYEDDLKKSIESLSRSQTLEDESKNASNYNSILSFEDSKTEQTTHDSTPEIISASSFLEKNAKKNDNKKSHEEYDYEYVSYYEEEEGGIEIDVPEHGKVEHKKEESKGKPFSNYNFMNTMTSADSTINENDKQEPYNERPCVFGDPNNCEITTSDIISDISNSPADSPMIELLNTKVPSFDHETSSSKEDTKLAFEGIVAGTSELSLSDEKPGEDEDKNISLAGSNELKFSLTQKSNNESITLSESDSPKKEESEKKPQNENNSVSYSSIISMFDSPSKSQNNETSSVFMTNAIYPSQFQSRPLETIEEEEPTKIDSSIISSIASSPVKKENNQKQNNDNDDSDFISESIVNEKPNASVVESDFVSTITDKSKAEASFASDIISASKSKFDAESTDFVSESVNDEKSKACSDFISEISNHQKKSNSFSDFISESRSELSKQPAKVNEYSDFISEAQESKKDDESDFISELPSTSAITNNDSDIISIQSSVIKKADSDDFESTFTTEKQESSVVVSEKKDSSSDFESTIKSQKQNSSSDFISEIKSEKPESSDGFISTIKSEKQESSEFISEIKSEKQESSDDFVSTIKSEKPNNSEFISEIKSEKPESSEFISEIKSEKPESSEFISEIKSEKPESSEFISEIKSEKQDTSDEFISTIKSQKQDESESISEIKSENNNTDEFISTIKSEKPSSSDDFISTIKSSSKVESSKFISTIKSTKNDDSDDFISSIISEEKGDDKSEFISAIKSEKPESSDEFISTIKSEKDGDSSNFISFVAPEKVDDSSEFISTIKSSKKQDSSDDFISAIISDNSKVAKTNVDNNVSSSDDFIVSMNSQISKEKSNETDDFISFISEKKSSLSKKDDSSSNFVSILQSGNNSKISQKESNSEFVSAIEYDESLKKVSESSVETVQIVSQATKTIEDEQSNSENDLFIFQSPVNNKQRAKIARPNMHSSEISGEQVELNGLRNIPLVITKKKKDNISISNEKIIKTIDRVARVDEETPRRKHRHHHHKSSDSETVPCIPRALQRSMLNSKNEKAKESPVKKLFFSNAVPFSTEDEEIKSNKVAQKKVKLSISMPLDVKDIIADEVEVTEMSASSIVSDEIPKPTILSFSSENELPKPKERKKKATLSFCNAANDIPPETSPTRNRLTHRSPKSKTEITSSKPSVYRTSTSSFSYLQPSYTLEPSSQIDTNYLNTIQSAKLQLASIQNSINISRQKRAMQESRLSQFKYTKNPFRA